MTHKSEAIFLQELEKRAHEERHLMQTEVLPAWARGLGEWLVVNPWRVLIPISVLVYSLLRLIYGVGMSEFVLGLFGGFR